MRARTRNSRVQPRVCAAIVSASLLWACYSAAGQELKVQDLEKHTELCNRVADVTPDERIASCTAVIASSGQTPRTRAIALNNRGNAYYKKNDYDRAIEDYDESIKTLPGYARAFNNRGLAFQKKGDLPRALDDFNQSIRHDPKSAPAFANRAEALRRKGDYRRAANDYTAAIRLLPTLEGVYNARCWVRAIIGELKPALADCNEALRMNPSAAAYDSRGLTYLKLRQWKSAVGDYSSALQLDPKLVSSLYGRGLAKVRSGDQAGGKADIAAATSMEADIERVFAGYGVK